MTPPKPKIYMDSCCFIEIAKGRNQNPEQEYSVDEAAMCERVLKAARMGDIELYTSTLTVAEALHCGIVPPPTAVQQIFERLFYSGMDGVITVAPDPFVIEQARDLTWKHGIREKTIDRVHVATALYLGCKEILSIDGKLAQRVGRSDIEGCRIVSARNSQYLPAKYRQDDLGFDAKKA